MSKRSRVRFPALVMCKSLGQALHPHCAYVHPAVMGTRWNERTIPCEWLQLQKMRCILPREMRLQEWVPIPGGKSPLNKRWILDYKQIPFLYIRPTLLHSASLLKCFTTLSEPVVFHDTLDICHLRTLRVKAGVSCSSLGDIQRLLLYCKHVYKMTL